MTYITNQGDTWDMISYKLYKDSRYMSELMQANPDHITTVIFSADVRLKTLVVEPQPAIHVPPWRRE